MATLIKIDVYKGAKKINTFTTTSKDTIKIGGVIVKENQLPNDVTLESDKIARRQAQIQLENGKYILSNLHKEVTVTLNGKPTLKAELKSGDTVGIGEYQLVFTQTHQINWFQVGVLFLVIVGVGSYFYFQKSPEELYNKALAILEKNHKNENAIPIMNKLVKKDPENEEYLLTRACAYKQTGIEYNNDVYLNAALEQYEELSQLLKDNEERMKEIKAHILEIKQFQKEKQSQRSIFK